MSTTTDEIIEKLKSITLLEASELVTQLEQTFGVDASASMTGSFAEVPKENTSANLEVDEEKTSFNVILQAIPDDKRIAVLKIVRDLTSLGLKESKEFTAELPKIVKDSVSKDEADTAIEQLQQAGATVKIE